MPKTRGNKKDEPYTSVQRLHALVVFGPLILLFLWFFTGWQEESASALSQTRTEPPELPPDNEHSAWATIEEKLKSTADKQEFQRKANWIANFPYQETRHPTLRHDPSVYDANDPSTWKGQNRQRYQPVIKAHGFMKAFFENERRFSKGFEDLYHLLEEYDRHENPIATGSIFESLGDYHMAASHPPDDIITETVFTGKFDELGQHITRLEPKKHYGPTGELLPPLTWGERAEQLADSIVYKIHARRRWPDKKVIPEAEAIAIRDRIITEIAPADIPQGMGFGYYNDYERSLQPGEAFIVPYDGWIEAQWKFQDNVVGPIMQRKAEELIERHQDP